MKNFEVKNAATIIVLRGSNENSKVLMGQRGEGASFMPNKFVFPGGAVDKGDSGIIPDDKINKEMLLNLKMKSENDPLHRRANHVWTSGRPIELCAPTSIELTI